MSNRSRAENLGGLLQGGRGLLSPLWLWEARFKGCTLGENVRFIGRPVICRVSDSRLSFGPGVSLTSSLRANPLGCFQPCVLRTLASGAELVLEARVGLSAAVICAAKSVRVGEGTILGAGAMIMDTDFHQPVGEFDWGSDFAVGAKPVVIGRGVFIGARAIILKGVTIGDRAIVGAGAVVTRDVPARHAAVGNPAQVIPLKGALASDD